MQHFATKKFQALTTLTIVAVALITYQPAFRIGFLDGWWYLDWVSRMDLPRYAIQFLDPANITQGYRPVQGLYILVVYTLFKFNPDGYHLTHNLLHAANAVLLFVITRRLARAWRVAMLAALLYVASPVYSLTVFWHAVVDPVSAFFYLLTIWLWTRYLESVAAAVETAPSQSQADLRRFESAKADPSTSLRACLAKLLPRCFGGHVRFAQCMVYPERSRRAQHRFQSPYYSLTWLAFLFALFSKEVAIFLPLLLFLIEWWFYGILPRGRDLLRQFTAFILPIFPYLALVVAVQSHGEFIGQFRFSVGPHMLISLVNYLAVLAFPWLTARPTDWFAFAWLGIAALWFSFVVVRAQSGRLFFLLIFAVLNVAPLTGFPLEYFNTRYLYLSVMASMILLALLFHHALARFRTRVVATTTAFVITLMVVGSSVMVADAAGGLAEYTRQLRVPFRDIARQHPSFPDDTYLYFVYSPKTPLSDLQGFFLVRYGPQLVVSGTEEHRVAGLRDHRNTFVYYFDEADRPREMIVGSSQSIRSSPPLPANFNVPIRLEGYELANPTVKRGDPLIILLYWRATGNIEKDYTVFVHLVDARGQMRTSTDSQPRQGNAPTSQWKAPYLVVDAMILPLADEMSPGERYHLKIGLYDLETGQRFFIVDERGQPITDHLVIEGISISE